jgi:hypothetical protein
MDFKYVDGLGPSQLLKGLKEGSSPSLLLTLPKNDNDIVLKSYKKKHKHKNILSISSNDTNPKAISTP